MRSFLLFLLLAIVPITIITSCAGGEKLSPDEMLAFSGREKLPTQEDYPDDGAVILYENFKDQLFLDSDWKVNVKESRHRAILYFNDKAEDWTTFSIYLDPEVKLTNFYARTIKPNGEVIELEEKDLHPTQLKADFVAFSDDQSVKFTFAGVEPGCILEYVYTVVRTESFYGGDLWPVQAAIPKLYTRFAVELPTIFFRYKYNWNYSPTNIELDPPQMLKNLVNQTSSKDRSRIYFWELKNIPALKSEPNMPPYFDVAQYVRVDLKYDNWNELTKSYWKRIKDIFGQDEDPYYKKLAREIVGDAKTDAEKIERIFKYTQEKYHYLAMNIGESGIIPHLPQNVIKNKYGDCKDMTVLNATLLNALGINAYPALVNTKDRGRKMLNLISLDFNHMITYVKTKEGKEYWLDATGSSCPLGEIYPSIEGVDALVIFKDGSSKFIKTPSSTYQQNQLKRQISYTLSPDGGVSGHAKLVFSGNENLSFRSRFKDANKKDMQSVIESWLNSNTPDLQIDTLFYDDPSEIESTFSMEFDFSKKNFASATGRLLIFKPSIFQTVSKLDRYRDIKRKFPIVYSAPYKISDEVEIHFPSDHFEVEAITKSIADRESFATFSSYSSIEEPGLISYKKMYVLKHCTISAGQYDLFRKVQKTIATANNENIVLRKKM